MERFSAIRNLFQYTISQMSQPHKQLILKENQVVMGHVLKLLPDQKALIKVGSSKLVAQLETSINALERYWFMVKGTEHQVITLKIVRMVEEDKIPQHAAAKDLLGLLHQNSKKGNNGKSLHQHQENGPTQQIITQIPLFMNNHQTDLTIQWNGKKTS